MGVGLLYNMYILRPVALVSVTSILVRTVILLNFRTPTYFTANILRFKGRGSTIMCYLQIIQME